MTISLRSLQVTFKNICKMFVSMESSPLIEMDAWFAGLLDGLRCSRSACQELHYVKLSGYRPTVSLILRWNGVPGCSAATSWARCPRMSCGGGREGGCSAMRCSMLGGTIARCQMSCTKSNTYAHHSLLSVFISHEIVKIFVLKIHLVLLLLDPIHDPNVIHFFIISCVTYSCVWYVCI